MSENTKVPVVTSKPDNVFEETSKRVEFFNEMDIYLKERGVSEVEELNCRFKDSCYALRNRMGACPCEFEEL